MCKHPNVQIHNSTRLWRNHTRWSRTSAKCWLALSVRQSVTLTLRRLGRCLELRLANVPRRKPFSNHLPPLSSTLSYQKLMSYFISNHVTSWISNIPSFLLWNGHHELLSPKEYTYFIYIYECIYIYTRVHIYIYIHPPILAILSLWDLPTASVWEQVVPDRSAGFGTPTELFSPPKKWDQIRKGKLIIWTNHQFSENVFVFRGGIYIVFREKKTILVW